MLLFVMLIPASLFSQKRTAEISPFAGYMFGGSLDYIEGNLKIDNGINYGLALDFKLDASRQVELMWTQMNTSAKFNPFSGSSDLATNNFDMNVGYLQIGGVQEFEYGSVNPFTVLSVGATYFSPSNVTLINSNTNVDVSTQWRFSVVFGAGAKIWVSEKVGIRIQGNLMLPMFWAGTGFTYGTGGGGFYVSSGTTLVQGGFTGGLIIPLGN